MEPDNSPAVCEEEERNSMDTSTSTPAPQPQTPQIAPPSPDHMDISSSTDAEEEPRTPPPSVLLMPPPPPPPPPPPISTFTPSARPPVARPPETPTIRVVSGTLTTAQRSSYRASRWLVVVLDFESALPFRLSAPSAVLEVVNIWRPRKASSFAESYTSFFPASSDLHIALLDPRSGERLHVWGEPSHEDGEAPEFKWDEVVKYLETFIAQHSIEGHDLGPLHHRDKPWAVSTRRESPAIDPLPPTSTMDDEEAAIAAAIAASLAESKKAEENEEFEMEDDDFEVEDEEDEELLEEEEEVEEEEEEEEEDSGANGNEVSSPGECDITANGESSNDQSSSSADMETPVSSRSTSAAVPIPGSWSDVASAGTPASYQGLPVSGSSDSDGEGGNGNTETPSIVIPGSRPALRSTPRRMSMSPALLSRNRMAGRSPALSRTPTFTPSSVESLSSSYLERAHSRLRSALDPALLESRALRLQQDAELAASLEEDRRKEREKRELEDKERRAKQERDDARNRLPVEPEKGVSVALRMPDGSRVARKFDPKTKLSLLADLCLAHCGVSIIGKSPNEVLWNRGSLKKDAAWTAEIGEVCTDTRVMFIVHQ